MVSLQLIELLQPKALMDKVIGLVITLFAVLLVFMSEIECHIIPPLLPNRPLCISQLAILNHACSALPVPPPSPPSPPSPEDKGRGHGHGHGHSQYHETPVEGECCRWLKQVDAECVCQLLVHLPPFLARPAHQFTVVVDESCRASFLCESRFRL